MYLRPVEQPDSMLTPGYIHSPSCSKCSRSSSSFTNASNSTSSIPGLHKPSTSPVIRTKIPHSQLKPTDRTDSATSTNPSSHRLPNCVEQVSTPNPEESKNKKPETCNGFSPLLSLFWMRMRYTPEDEAWCRLY